MTHRPPLAPPLPAQQTGAATDFVRLCRYCAHFRPPTARLDYPTCRAPSVATDTVTGRPIYGLPCTQPRRRTGRCGVEGRWWQAAT
jgi:hypothetical protein